MPGPFVIVGAGQAGLQIAESLRHEKYEGPIILLGAEAHAPYNRPPLSKQWLLERRAPAALAIRSIEAIQRRHIDLRVGTNVTGIDRAAQLVHCADGQRIPYGGLALATGARLRTLAVPGTSLGGVHTLRTIDDAQSIAASLDRCAARSAPVIVIGGGFIGLEVAATARKLGLEVTVLEGLGRLMSRAVAPIVSEAAAQFHRAHGVRLVFDARVVELLGAAGEVRAVRMADGQEYPAGCVVMGVGIDPDDTLASAAGLRCDRGILVDDYSCTSDPLIVAAGDCCARRREDGALLRLESVQNAAEQGMSAAVSLLGRQRAFSAAPWFWSDQYDVKLQMVGLSAGYDQVVTRGDTAKPAFSAFYYRGGKLIAVDSLSRIPDHMVARKLLDRGLSPTPEQAADPNFDLHRLLAA
ncbi:MAG TPA: FAD-dependent oxidoreductase [Steroidobacteraceae bacterium]|nr:FAD-dependent oxidoreductase [Steroidobacteraceae bacterium]